MQKILSDVFYDSASQKFRIANDFLAILTIVSIVGIALGTVESLENHPTFTWIEYITVFFFSLEYLGRTVGAKKPLGYVFSFFGIIDLLAIIPSYLGFTNLSFLKSARILRILRLLRMLRLIKIVRSQKMRYINDDDHHTSLLRLNIQIYVVTLFAAILLSGSLIWAVEGHRTVFANIPLAMLWGAKTLLGGVPQAVVETVGGEVIVIFARFVGLILFGLLINIVGGSVKKFLLGSAQDE